MTTGSGTSKTALGQQYKEQIIFVCKLRGEDAGVMQVLWTHRGMHGPSARYYIFGSENYLVLWVWVVT